jgi:hypothetical protein
VPAMFSRAEVLASICSARSKYFSAIEFIPFRL